MFKTRRRWLTIANFCDDLKLPQEKVTDLIDQMQRYLKAPIEYSDSENAYRYTEGAINGYRLPDFWLTPDEIICLTKLNHSLNNLCEGLLSEEFEQFYGPIQDALRSRKINSHQFNNRVKYFPKSHQQTFDDHFSTVCSALLERRQLSITYQDSRTETSAHTLCPQLLVHRNDSWMLEAWCHMHRSLRSFSIARIEQAEMLKERSREIAQKNLDIYFDNRYGLNQQRPQLLVLKFNADAAYEVASQCWHFEQSGVWQDDSYVLTLPLIDEENLVKKVLQYLPSVEVVAPESFQQHIRQILTQALERHEKSATACNSPSEMSESKIVKAISSNTVAPTGDAQKLKQA
ncbi:WYL domain-containing protein [Sessilibacter corallicola]|uniref:WYL domain-containing protein n=2 Tax=Sessilibacter corallicola TaxID=2904075 RepID=A0ABQ0A926_9GAMM